MIFEKFRKLTRFFLWAILFSFIIGTIFFMWEGSTWREHQDFIAKVDGEAIPSSAFHRLYEHYYSLYARMRNMEKDFIKDLKKHVLEQLLREHILLKFAKKMHIPVMEEEIIDEIRELFKDKERRFDEKTYRFYLEKAPSSWWKNLEEREENEILLKRLEALFKDTEFPSKEEVRWQKIFRGQKMHIFYIIENTEKDAKEALKRLQQEHLNISERVFTPSDLEREWGKEIAREFLVLCEGDVIGPYKIKNGYLSAKLLRRSYEDKVEKEDIESILWWHRFWSFEDFYTFLKQEKKIQINEALIDSSSL